MKTTLILILAVFWIVSFMISKAVWEILIKIIKKEKVHLIEYILLWIFVIAFLLAVYMWYVYYQTVLIKYI